MVWVLYRTVVRSLPLEPVSVESSNLPGVRFFTLVRKDVMDSPSPRMTLRLLMLSASVLTVDVGEDRLCRARWRIRS